MHNKINLLAKQPIFTSKEARKCGLHPSLISYYVKKGLINRIKRGVYQSQGIKTNSEFRWTDLVQAVYGVHRGVICLISALAIYELTEEPPPVSA